MPFYEYRCEACGELHEALEKVSDDPLVECPACGVPALQRLISAPSFRLKGGGWYETDFKSGSKRNLAESAGAESKPTEAKPTEAKPVESKPAATPKPESAS